MKSEFRSEIPLIDVVVPCYNSECYLESCIESILISRRQVNEYIRIFIVNDGSIDNTSNILSKYKEKEGITIINNSSNKGQIYSTNRGLKLTRSNWVQIIHADDTLKKNHFKIMIELIKKFYKEDIALIVAERDEIDSKGNKIGELSPFYKFNCRVKGLDQADVFLRSGFLPCQVLMRRKILKELEFLDNSYEVNLDGLLWFKMSLKGDTIYIRNKTSNYRRHNSSVTSNLDKTAMHIFEYYSTIKRMISYYQSYYPSSSVSSNRYIPSLIFYTIKIIKRIIHSKDSMQTVNEYLNVAEILIKELDNFCSDEIILMKKEIDKYRQMLINPNNSKKDEITLRQFSYDPPDGSLRIDQG